MTNVPGGGYSARSRMVVLLLVFMKMMVAVAVVDDVDHPVLVDVPQWW